MSEKFPHAHPLPGTEYDDADRGRLKDLLFLFWRWSRPWAMAVATSTQPSPTMAARWADPEGAWTASASSHGKILFSAHTP